MSSRRVFHGIAANVVAFAASVGIQLVSVPLLIHLWGLSQYGIWIIISTIPSYLILSNFGLNVAASNDMAALLARGERKSAQAIYSTAFWSIIAIATFLIVIGVSVAALVPTSVIPAGEHVDPEQLRAAIIALVIYSALALTTEAAMVPFRASGGYARAVYTSSVIVLLERTAFLGAAFWGIGTAACAFATVRLIGVIVMFLSAFAAHPDLRPRLSDASLHEARRIGKLGFGIILFTLAMAINLQGVILALGILVAPAAVAVFSASRTLTRFGVQATSVVSSSVMAEFAIASGESSEARQRRLFAFNVAAGGVLLAGAFAFMLLLGPQLTYIWMAKSALPDFTMFAVLAAGTTLQGFWIIAANLLMAANKQYSFTPMFVAVAIGATALSFAVTPVWGTAGVAAVLFCAELLMCVWVYRQTVRLGVGRLRDVPPLAAEMVRTWWAKRGFAKR